MLKKYLKLFAIINGFFLFLVLALVWENFQNVGGYGGYFTLGFMPVVFMFVLQYGWYSAVRIKSIILPNLLLLIIMFLYFFVIFDLNRILSNYYYGVFNSKAVKISLFGVGISVLSGLMAKLWLLIKSKIKQRHHKLQLIREEARNHKTEI